jgi:hypothetical protein
MSFNLRFVPGFLFLVFVGDTWTQATPGSDTPANFTIAFIGDQGFGKEARDVLRLIKAEGAQAVLHQGDFDRTGDPSAWNKLIGEILGPDFPYFATIGNQDVGEWEGEKGYQQQFKNRLKRLEIPWDGDLGVKSSFRYKGIFIVQVSPGLKDGDHAGYIREQLKADKSLWRICSWHKDMRLMQVGGKADETGWEVYEEARMGGAIIATAHEHSYSRTHLLSSCKDQTVADDSNLLTLTRGKTFVFVSGLGGYSIRPQVLSGKWWAKIYTKTQGATYGALFGQFNAGGTPNQAKFYFKNIKGEIVDQFDVVSDVK